MSELLQRGELHDPNLQRLLITVGEVRVSPDLRIATAYVLPLGGDNVDEALEALRRNKGILRHLIGKTLELKHAPELRFFPDETFDRMDETRRMLDQAEVKKDLDP